MKGKTRKTQKISQNDISTSNKSSRLEEIASSLNTTLDFEKSVQHLSNFCQEFKKREINAKEMEMLSKITANIVYFLVNRLPEFQPNQKLFTNVCNILVKLLGKITPKFKQNNQLEHCISSCLSLLENLSSPKKASNIGKETPLLKLFSYLIYENSPKCSSPLQERICCNLMSLFTQTNKETNTSEEERKETNEEEQEREENDEEKEIKRKRMLVNCVTNLFDKSKGIPLLENQIHLFFPILTTILAKYVFNAQFSASYSKVILLFSPPFFLIIFFLKKKACEQLPERSGKVDKPKQQNTQKGRFQASSFPSVQSFVLWNKT